ncbi:MAG: MerR family transcriptional regulator [Gemmatimonadales bacterium]
MIEPGDPAPDPAAAPRYPVRLVATRTGLSPHVLRAWERRHHAVEPSRTAGGQRLYSELDIERLRQLRRLSEGGHSIGSLAGLSLEELTRLDQDIALQLPTTTTATLPYSPGTDSVANYTEAALDATRRLDARSLQTLLERAAITLGAVDFLDRVAGPVLNEIGTGWTEGTVSVAQEHMATAVFRRVLSWLLGVYEVEGARQRVIVATPPGEMHEMGALMVAVSAAAEGWGVTYLGPDLPVDDLLEAAGQSDAGAVAISAVHAPDRLGVEASIRAIRAGLPRSIPLIVGGAAAPDLEPTDDGVLKVQDLNGLRAALQLLATEADA